MDLPEALRRAMLGGAHGSELVAASLFADHREERLSECLTAGLSWAARVECFQVAERSIHTSSCAQGRGGVEELSWAEVVERRGALPQWKGCLCLGVCASFVEGPNVYEAWRMQRQLVHLADGVAHALHPTSSPPAPLVPGARTGLDALGACRLAERWIATSASQCPLPGARGELRDGLRSLAAALVGPRPPRGRCVVLSASSPSMLGVEELAEARSLVGSTLVEEGARMSLCITEREGLGLVRALDPSAYTFVASPLDETQLRLVLELSVDGDVSRAVASALEATCELEGAG